MHIGKGVYTCERYTFLFCATSALDYTCVLYVLHALRAVKAVPYTRRCIRLPYYVLNTLLNVILKLYREV